MQRKKAQVWVETMVYTLIAFALIGIVLAFVKPKIEEAQDKVVIEQSIKILEDINSIFNNLGGSGNQRVISLAVKKGSFIIDGESDTLFFRIESKYEYSQPGTSVNVGSIIATTEEKGKINEVTLLSDYSSIYDIRVNGISQKKEITKSQTPYSIKISEGGTDATGKIVIDLNF